MRGVIIALATWGISFGASVFFGFQGAEQSWAMGPILGIIFVGLALGVFGPSRGSIIGALIGLLLGAGSLFLFLAWLLTNLEIVF